jgi:hypothetical protein
MKDTGEMERTIAASFLLVHACQLVVLDLVLALTSLGTGAVGLAMIGSSGLEESAIALGLAAGSGGAAAVTLAWALGEATLAIRALRGSTRSLFPLSLASLLASALLLPISLLGCNVLGGGIVLPMVLVAGIATAFAGLATGSPPSSSPPSR